MRVAFVFVLSDLLSCIEHTFLTYNIPKFSTPHVIIRSSLSFLQDAAKMGIAAKDKVEEPKADAPSESPPAPQVSTPWGGKASFANVSKNTYVTLRIFNINYYTIFDVLMMT